MISAFRNSYDYQAGEFEMYLDDSSKKYEMLYREYDVGSRKYEG